MRMDDNYTSAAARASPLQLSGLPSVAAVPGKPQCRHLAPGWDPPAGAELRAGLITGRSLYPR